MLDSNGDNLVGDSSGGERMIFNTASTITSSDENNMNDI